MVKWNPNVGGHPEIELALVKLDLVTGEQKYFDLAEWFINQHGTRPNNYGAYYVDFVPVRQMSDFRGCHVTYALPGFSMRIVSACAQIKKLHTIIETIYLY
jgi:DUF1680 family protein